MSITITTGGITMTGGGVSFTAPPPTTPNASWVAGGGYPPMSTVDRITYATDTATASVRGPLSWAVNKQAATANLAYGWWAGGVDNVAPNDIASTVQRITYATDTAVSSIRGPLNSDKWGLAAAGTQDYGWFAGGFTGPSIVATVDRVTFATDTTTASGRGPLSAGYRGLSATSDGTTYGWYIGGTPQTSGSFGTSTVQRITFANDTGSSSIRGSLSAGNYGTVGGKYFGAATGNSDYGWVFGGFSPSNNITSTVQRIDYANDTASSSVRGPLLVDVIQSAAVTSNSYGWNGGGLAGGATSATINRITYATDTTSATNRGPLSAAQRYLSATSGIQ